MVTPSFAEIATDRRLHAPLNHVEQQALRKEVSTKACTMDEKARDLDGGRGFIRITPNG